MAAYRELCERRMETTIVNAMGYTDKNVTLAEMLEPNFFTGNSRVELDGIVLLRASDGWAWAHVAGYDYSTGKKCPVLELFRTDAAPASEPVKSRKAA